MNGGRDLVEDHKANKNGRGQKEIDHLGNNSALDKDLARKVDLGQEPSVAHQGIDRAHHRVGEQCPGQQTSVEKDWVGHPEIANAQNHRENKGHDDHLDEGIEDHPGVAKHRLLVALLDLTLGQL